MTAHQRLRETRNDKRPLVPSGHMGEGAKVLVLVLSIDRDPWLTVEREGIRATWAERSPLDSLAPVLYYRGSSNLRAKGFGAATAALSRAARGRERSVSRRLRLAAIRVVGSRTAALPCRRDGDIIRTATPETYGMLSAKLLAALRHVVATEQFDYVLRTNSSTYIDRAGLVDHVQAAPALRHYAGYHGTGDFGIFASGAGFIMSRDLVEAAIWRHADWDLGLVDDVAVGQLLAQMGVTPVHLQRPQIRTAEEARAAHLDKAFMWRCKTFGDNRTDADLMRILHRRLAPA